jgi:DNA primase large subunit
MDIIDFANIPCTTGALEYLKESSVGSADVCTDMAYESVRSAARGRIIEALNNGTLKYRRYNEPAANKELLAYPVARIIVSSINNTYLTKRYALAVARLSYEHIMSFRAVALGELAADFGINVTVDARTMSATIHFTDYIHHAHVLHEPKWKLSSRTVKEGMLTISKGDFARLMEEVIRKKVESGLPHEVPQEIRDALKQHINEVQEAANLRANKQCFSKEGFSEVNPGCFPPCISSAIADAQTNVNLSHSMRFAMTTFLLNIGMKPEKITEIFRASPDFREQDTNYQINHIGGASGTAYTCPTCATMTTNGNCPGNTQCKKIENPLVYYRRKVWILNKKQAAQVTHEH